LFNDYSSEEIAELEAVLVRLRKAVTAARNEETESLADETDE
jgi:hypothetical protein